MSDAAQASADSGCDLIALDSVSDRTKPQHHFFAEEEQFRLKVQRFTRAPAEVTIQRISFERDTSRYLRAAELGFGQVTTPRRVRDPSRAATPESVERSQFRARTRVRLNVMELAPNALVTFTTRAVFTLDDLAEIWAGFVRRVRVVEPLFEYLCVPEPHPSNPDHFHLHAATRGRIARNTLRRLWHIAIEAFKGRRVTAILRGVESPGNIDEQPIKGRETIARMRKIAKYISKYITKDLVERFNRRRYWPSKGINVQAAQAFWLDSLNQADAIREACGMLGHLVEGVAPAFKLFRPSERVCWYAVNPAEIPDPPF